LDDIHLGVLFGALVALLVLAAFFSGSETGLFTLNRYRLRHLVTIKHRGAILASKLLDRTDRLIGLLMLGNNFANNLATAVATVIGLRLLGEAGVAAAAALLTLIGLIFSETAPKTLAALHPERVAFPAAYLLTPLLKLFHPIIWLVNTASNGLLKLFGVSAEGARDHDLSSEELRTVVIEAGAMIPRRHQKMLLSILDLEKVTVEDIMVPRSEIVGIDLDNNWEDLTAQLTNSQHTRLLVFVGGIENIIGIVHVRDVLRLIVQDNFSKDAVMEIIHESYFVPEATPLNTQLLNFQRQKRRVALVVDEYGDLQGLVTLEDILEEIVGQFTSDPSDSVKAIHLQADGSYLVDGSTTVRELNKMLFWKLPTDGPKTLNGLILEYLESMPEPGTSMLLFGYSVEIIQISANSVKTAKIRPAQQVPSPATET
jgi:Mg2+/Co2+ transporter CorB